MDKALPDKWVRKAVYDAVDGVIVDTNTINCYDSRVTASTETNYILLSTQSNEVNDANKCEYVWESQILIEVFTRASLSGNTGSRLLADNIADSVRNLTKDLKLDAASNLTIIRQKQSFPSDLVAETDSDIIYRKFIRIEFLIN